MILVNLLQPWPFWFLYGLLLSLAIFCLSKLLFSGFLQPKGNKITKKSVLLRRDWQEACFQKVVYLLASSQPQSLRIVLSPALELTHLHEIKTWQSTNQSRWPVKSVSLTWAAHVQIYWHKRKCLHKIEINLVAVSLFWDTNMATVSDIIRKHSFFRRMQNFTGQF